MRDLIYGLAAIVLLGSCQTSSGVSKDRISQNKQNPVVMMPGTNPIVLLIHGGAGSARPGGMPEEDEAEYRAALSDALTAGYTILQAGGSSLDAVQASLTILEDDPLFNAGRGSVLSANGKVSMDASVMDGSNRNAGAVAGINEIRHPVLAASAVMNNSPHVLLFGSGAEQFAKDQGLETMPESWFITEPRVRQLNRIKQKERKTQNSKLDSTSYFGTVGAVALDTNGNLAAATSTGGMTNKKWGRVGDSPIIGAGIYADNQSCAVSATGWGEYFIRGTVARDICARIQWTGANAQLAADQEIAEIVEAGGSGGVLVLTPDGDYAFSFSTAVMFRGVRTEAGEEVAIFASHGNRQLTD